MPSLNYTCPNCQSSISLPIVIDWNSYACANCKTHTGDASSKGEVLNTYVKRRFKRLAVGRQAVIDNELWTIVAYSEQQIENAENEWWYEYQLVNDKQAYRYLSAYKDQWMIAEELEIPNTAFTKQSRVTIPDEGTYRLYSHDYFKVSYAEGFFMDFRMKDKAIARDYICPPYAMLIEINDAGVTQYKAKHISAKTLKQAFPKTYFPIPWRVNRLSPLFSSFAETAAIILLTLSLIMMMLLASYGKRTVIADMTTTIDNQMPPVKTDVFELNQFVQMVTIRAHVPNIFNDWVTLGYTLINVDTGQEYYTESTLSHKSYYDTYEEEHRESSHRLKDAKFCQVMPGRYMIKIVNHSHCCPGLITISIYNGGTNTACLWISLSVIGLLLCCILLFNRARWRNSEFSIYNKLSYFFD